MAGQQQEATDLINNFLKQYYAALDKIEFRPFLKQVYQEFSVLRYEGNLFQGQTAILEKLMALPPKMSRVVSAIDIVPMDGRVLVCILGQMKTDAETDHALPYNQSLILAQQGDAIFIVAEVFRLGLHDM